MEGCEKFKILQGLVRFMDEVGEGEADIDMFHAWIIRYPIVIHNCEYYVISRGIFIIGYDVCEGLITYRLTYLCENAKLHP